MYTFVDRMMDSMDELRRGMRGWTKADHSQYFPVACAHSDKVLALHNGSLMSVIKIGGYMGQYFPEQFEQLSTKWARFLQTATRDKSAKGFDLFWSYEYDPEGMGDTALGYRERMIRAGERRKLNNRDIMVEEAELYGKFCAIEHQYLMIVTHLDSLPKADQGDALKRSAADRKNAARGANAIAVLAGVRGLEAVHAQHVNKVMVFLKDALMGYTYERLDCYDALWVMRYSFAPGTTGPGWKARLTMNDCRLRPTEDVPCAAQNSQTKTGAPTDWSMLLPPPLAEQMVPDGVIDLGRYVVVGDRTYAPMHVSELAVDPQPIEELLRMCYQRRLPVRMVFSLMSNSEQSNYWNRFFASIFNFASASNRQIVKADRAMKAYQEGNGAVFGYGVSISTWAPTEVTYDAQGHARYDVKTLQLRAQDIETLMQQWGGQQIDNIFGCSVEALMGATPGFCMPPSCPKAPQIDLDVIRQLPIMRSARIWEPDNSIWFRSGDGVLLPYQPFSGRQNAMLSLVMGGMGYGKSNLLSEHIFYFANHPEAEDMPYIRGIDFGASSSGVIDMVRDSLPADRKHEAVFESFSNNGKMKKNLMDTRLGLRHPLEDHEKFLISWLLILCDSLIAGGEVTNVVAVLSATVRRAYEIRDPSSNLFEPIPFLLSQADPGVADKVRLAGLPLDEDTHYWEIVDGLVEFGIANNEPQFLHAAKIAQRHCVPQYADLVRAAEMLTDQFKNMPEVSGKSMVSAVTNALMNANSMFPCFTGITNTDVSESRICVFDMSEAFGRGNTAYDDWMRSVYFAIVYRLLTEDLFVNKKLSGDEMTRNQHKLGVSDKLLKWHLDYLEVQDQMIKVFWGDELHRIGKVHGAFQMLESLAYEGRKYRVGLMMGTQMPQHFPPDMLKLASSIFIFGASQSAENATVLQSLFDLSQDERQTVLDITKPNAEKGAEVFVIHKTDLGIQRLKLHFQMGSIKRWAYATESEERGLRGLLYAEGPSSAWARKILADRVPDAKKAIAAKQQSYAGEMSQQEAVRRIADDLLRFVE